MIVSSSYSEGQYQEDGRRWVREYHITGDGELFTYEWLGDQNANLILAERANKLNELLAEQEAARDFVADTEIGIPPVDFMRRFSLPEEAGIRQAAKTDPMVEVLLARLLTVRRVVLDHPETVGGIQYLVARGLLSQTRASEVLND